MKEKQEQLRRALAELVIAFENLASAYSNIGWDLSSENAEQEARRYRRQIGRMDKKKRRK